MDTSDFTFMKSGFDNTPVNVEEMQKNIASILIHFTENAMRSAAIYTKHSKRNVVTKEDIKRGMMLEAFLFGARENTAEKVEEIKNEVYGNDDSECSSDEEDMNLYDEEDEDVEFTESTHNCQICKTFN